MNLMLLLVVLAAAFFIYADLMHAAPPGIADLSVWLLLAALIGLFVWVIVAVYRGRRLRHDDSGSQSKSRSMLRTPQPPELDSYHQGLQYLEAGDLDAAEQCFRDSIAEENFTKSSALRLADIAQRRDDPELAAELRKRATVLKDVPSTTNNPDSDHALEGLIERSELETARRTVRLIQDCTIDVRPISSATFALTWKAGVLFFVAILLFLIMASFRGLPRVVGFSILSICAILGVRYLYKAWVVNTSRYEMRDGLIILHQGGFSRNTFVMEIFRISNVSVHRSFINRMTNDGSLYVIPDKSDGYFNFDLLGIAKSDELPDLQLKLRELNRLLRIDPRIKGIIR